MFHFTSPFFNILTNDLSIWEILTDKLKTYGLIYLQ